MRTNKNVSDTLEKLSNYWKNNANIHQFVGDLEDITFRPDMSDFSENLLPFASHPAWKDAPFHIKKKCLSYGWILYNMKTVYIECDIVTPVCEDIIKYQPQSGNVSKIQKVISEALLDEALHTKMSISACNYIYEKRGLEHLGENEFYLSRWLEARLLACKNRRERQLVHLAIACASETLITDYLDSLSKDTSIQKICYEVTRRHAIDERSHSGVFSNVALDLLIEATEDEKKLFKATVLETLPVFANTEMAEWEKVFMKLDFPNYSEIVRDTEQLQNTGIYDKSVNKLLMRLGMN